jgi:hypothetical protein
MPLSEDDVREILRLIDESSVEELRVETPAFSLFVRRGSVGDSRVEPQTAAAALPAADGLLTTAPMLGRSTRPGPGAAP